MKIKGLTFLAAISVTLFVWINFIDFKFYEPFEGAGKKIEYFVETMALSYLGGYMFYYLNIYLVEKKEQDLILPFIYKQAYFIIHTNHFIIKGLKNDGALKENYYPDYEEWDRLLNNVFPKDKFPLHSSITWYNVLAGVQKNTQDKIDKIFLSGKYVDEELRLILLELLDSGFLEDGYIESLKTQENVTLVNGYPPFNTYFDIIKRLKAYHDRRPHKPYKLL